jgi:hypothetical protein
VFSYNLNLVGFTCYVYGILSDFLEWIKLFY